MVKGNREEAIRLLSETKLKIREIAEQTGVPMGSLGNLSNQYRSKKVPVVTKPKAPVGRPKGPAPKKGDLELAAHLLRTTKYTLATVQELTGVSYTTVADLSRNHRDRQAPRGPQFQTIGVSAIMTPDWIHERLVEKGMTLQEMADELGVSRERVRQILAKHKINVRDYADKKQRYWRKNPGEVSEVNKHYFDVIDTEEKAYWLGYLTARGRVAQANDHARKTLELGIAPKNRDHFELFKDTIQAEVEIHSSWHGQAQREYHRMSIKSHYLASKLEEYHIETPKHDLTRLPEQVPEELVRHYFRGYYDGKGFVHTGLNGGKERMMLLVYGSDPMLYDWCTLITETLKVELSSGAVSTPSDTHLNHKFLVHAPDKIKRILDHLYVGSTIYQDRNYNKYRECFYNGE